MANQMHGFDAEGNPSQGAAAALAGYATLEDLAGAVGADWEDELAAHVASSTPHPQYDDLPSLTLLFQNRLV